MSDCCGYKGPMVTMNTNNLYQCCGFTVMKDIRAGVEHIVGDTLNCVNEKCDSVMILEQKSPSNVEWKLRD